MKFIVLTHICFHIILLANAQAYMKEGKNRHTFAQTTIGYNLDFTTANGSYLHFPINQMKQ